MVVGGHENNARPPYSASFRLLRCIIISRRMTAVGQKRECGAIGGGADARPVYPRKRTRCGPTLQLEDECKSAPK